MYKRTIEKVVKEVSKDFPVLLIAGPRQVGKTTLLEKCKDKKRNYVSLDDLNSRILAKNDPALFLQTYTSPIIIDEIQYGPELFSYIKLEVDKKKKNGLFWITGSQKFLLMKNINESLAGRVAILDLLGLSQAELDHNSELSKPFIPDRKILKKDSGKNLNLAKLYKRIWLGSFPRIHVNRGRARDIFYKSYIQTYLQRDISDILKVTDQEAFYRFLCAVAARTAQLLNYADLARDSGIDPKTAKSWMSVLETSGLVYILKPYFSNLSKRLVKAPKIYFLDTGLCSYLTKWSSSELLEAGAMSGAILETYFFSEILKSYWYNGLEANFYYYRDQDQLEIDLLIEQNDLLYPVEFKKTATPSIRASKSFFALEKLDKKIGLGAIICLIDKPIMLSQTVIALPINCI